MTYKHKRTIAVANRVGSRIRNLPPKPKNPDEFGHDMAHWKQRIADIKSGKTIRSPYGFMADMRLKLDYQMGIRFRAYRAKFPRRQWKRIRRDIRQDYGQHTVTHYGTRYLLEIVNPYCVVRNLETGETVGVMPLDIFQRLTG